MFYDVMIVGGGIVGCAIARELTRYQLRVLLLEKDAEVGFGTTKSNSGIIHAGHHSSPGTLKGRLEWQGNPLWDRLQLELGFGFVRVGELTVARMADDVATLERLKAQGQAKGVPGLELWDRARIRHEEPNLTEDIIAALHAPTAGVINPYEACFALAHSAVINGLDLRTEAPVTQLEPIADGWTIHTPRGTFSGRFIINAAGVFADRIADMAGARNFTLVARKGEEYLLDKRLEGLVKHIIFPCPTPVSKGILVIPTVDGTIMVGPTAHETDARDDLATSATGAAEIFAQVRQIVPGISERDCIAEFAGLRAVAESEDFIIGTTPKKGFINAAGIQSPGLTASPAIALMMVNLLRDEGLRLIPNDDFVASIPYHERFALLPTSAQAALAADDPRWGHIICRCETVCEREIAASIEAGARTLDGIKFRTRAGMGRCQGAFCTWRCMEMLAENLNIPVTDVTKRGGDSWVICAHETES